MTLNSRFSALLLLALGAGCSGPQGVSTPAPAGSVSPGARPEIVRMLREDLAAPRHPSDGGGRGWIEDPAAEPVPAGGASRWTLIYEAGPLGIARGGMLFLQVSPFWGWSSPQVSRPEAPGFTRVSTAAAGVDLDVELLGRGLLGIRVEGRALAAEERVRIEYGAGPAGALADRYAERDSRIWLAVDGDGDGVRALVPDSPTVDVGPGPAARLALLLPTTARPGGPVRLTLAVLDPLGNAGVPYAGEIALEGEGLGLPAAVRLEPGDGGRAHLEVAAPGPGIYRVRGRSLAGDLSGLSNPLVVNAAGERVLWGDLHGHSAFSDGTGTPEDYFTYAREVAALDVAALTDHDHWGLQPLSRHPEMWQEIRRQVKRFHRPGRFVTLLGYEWTNWIYGHRHVLYFREGGDVLSSLDPEFETPQQLWEALRGKGALTFAHHSAGGPIATDWDIPPDPELEPVTEIVSVHGASEAPDAPRAIYQPVPGNYVRDALDRGYRLGFIGSGDSHDGHPGLAGIVSPSGGLAAILSEELTRGGVMAALKARRVYATNGPRILLRASLDGELMGSTLEAGRRPRQLAVEVVAEGPLERVDLVRSGRVVETVEARGEERLSLSRRISGLGAGEYLYVRAVQEDGGAAWSSPFFFE